MEFRRKLFGELWYYPQDRALDIAVASLTFGELADQLHDVNYTVMPLTLGANPYTDAPFAYMHNFEEVLFAGYPKGIWDPRSGYPVVRRGVTATPLDVPYEGRPEFLIDGAVYPGCSGAPVVVIQPELVAPPQTLNASWGQRIREEDRFAFLGMITDVRRDPDTGEPLLNLGYAVRARKIFDVIREYETLIGRAA